MTRSDESVNRSPISAVAMHVKTATGWDEWTPNQRATATAEFQRPVDTTQYNSFDVISNSTLATTLMEFPLAPSNGGRGTITKVRLNTDNASFPAQTRLMLYTVPSASLPGGVIAVDNAQLPLRYANRAVQVGFVDLPTLAPVGTGSDCSIALADGLSLDFQCAAGDTKLYGVLVTYNSVTPISGQSFSVEITARVLP